MAFQGSLAELHLPDIIQLVSVSGKSGVFRLIDGEHRGDIWLQEGRIVHAVHEDLSGEEAVYALAIWRTGEFRFEAGIDSPRQTITKSNTNLLMEAARRLVARAVEEDPVGRAGAGVRDPREPRGPDQPEHDGVAAALQDRRAAQRQADRGRRQRGWPPDTGGFPASTAAENRRWPTSAAGPRCGAPPCNG